MPPPPRGQGKVRLIVARRTRGVHDVLETGELSTELGLVGDRWHKDDGDPLYQVTIMSAHVARLVRATPDQPLHTAGDNFFVDLDLSEEAVPVGARLRMGEALLEVTAEPHLGCKNFRERFGEGALAWVNHKDHRALRLRGVNCRIIESGMVSTGDDLVVSLPRTAE